MSTKYWKGGMAGAEGSWADALVSKTLDNTAIVDLGGTPNRVRIDAATHTFIEKDYVVINGTTNYDGAHRVVNVNAAGDFDIEAPYVAETPAGNETLLGSNWQDKDGVPVAVPVAADTVIFDDSAGVVEGEYSRHTERSHWNCIDSLAQGDTGELELTDLFIESGFLGNIGIDSENTISAFHISVADSGGVYFRGQGKVYIECSADDAITSINIPLLVVDTASGYINIASDMNSGSYTSMWNVIKCFNRGTLQIADNTAVGAIYTYNSNVGIIIGTGCVEVADSNDEIDLYVNDTGDIPTPSAPSAVISCVGPINFGSAALTLNKSI